MKLLVERGISDVSTRRVLLWGIKHKDVESIVWSLQRGMPTHSFSFCMLNLGALTEDLDLSKLFAAENKEIINALCHCERFDRKSIDIACTVLKGDELSFGNEKNEYVAFLLDKGTLLCEMIALISRIYAGILRLPENEKLCSTQTCCSKESLTRIQSTTSRYLSHYAYW